VEVERPPGQSGSGRRLLVGDRFKKEEVKKGTFKIRDTENEKWVRD
jgi:hypothetical protein